MIHNSQPLSDGPLVYRQCVLLGIIFNTFVSLLPPEFTLLCTNIFEKSSTWNDALSEPFRLVYD